MGTRVAVTSLCVVLAALSGCATRQLVPLEDGAAVNLAERSATRTLDEVTVTLTGSPWTGEPAWLTDYATPVYAVVENRGADPIELGYGDLVIFDEQRAQYPALPPETVAARIQSGWAYRVAPPPSFFIGGRFIVGSPRRFPAWESPFWPWWYDPWWASPWYDPWWYGPWPYGPAYVPPRSPPDIYALALPVGSVRPHARIRGFIYFTHLPASVQRITISISYKRSGETAPHEVTFPFVVKENATGD